MIDGSLYKTISDYLGELDSLGTEAITYNSILLSTINNINTSRVQEDKANVIRNKIGEVSDRITRNHVRLSPQLRDVVRALQSMILSHYASIDTFLVDNGILVSADFASLSDKCGYNISIANIE